MNLKNLAQDKGQHFVGGAFIAAIAAAIAVELAPSYAWQVALVASLAAGIIKEGLDWRANRQADANDLPRMHTVDGADALATLCGGLPVALPLFAWTFKGLPWLTQM